MQYFLATTLSLALLSFLISPVNVLAHFGIFLCFILSAVGTALGILSISKYVSGASIKSPRIGTKSILGTVVCEANFLTGIITCVMISNGLNNIQNKTIETNNTGNTIQNNTFINAILNNTINSLDDDRRNYIYFATGLFVGLCNYFSSVATGLICAVISMMDAKDSKLFFKIVILEIIPASVGLIGFIIGIVLTSKV